VFRSLLPPGLRKATNQHKISCCCFVCVFIDYLHSAHNKWRSTTVLTNLEQNNQKYQDMVGILPRHLREAKAQALDDLFTYKQEPFKDALHPRPKDVVYSVQCPSPPGFEGTGITKLACALGKCPDCPKYK